MTRDLYQPYSYLNKAYGDDAVYTPWSHTMKAITAIQFVPSRPCTPANKRAPI